MKKINFILFALLATLFYSILNSCKKEETFHYVLNGTITERITGMPVSGEKVFLSAHNVDRAPLILWDDSTYSDASGNFSFEYSGQNDPRGHGCLIYSKDRNWDCSFYANPTLDSTTTFVSLSVDPASTAALYFHNTTGNQERGASVSLPCYGIVSVMGHQTDTLLFRTIAGGRKDKFDWDKTLNGAVTETVYAADSVYVVPGDTVSLHFNY